MIHLKDFLINENYKNVDEANEKLEKVFPGFNKFYDKIIDDIRNKFKKEFKKIDKNVDLTFGEDHYDWGPDQLKINSDIPDDSLNSDILHSLKEPVKGYTIATFSENSHVINDPYFQHGYRWNLPHIDQKYALPFLQKTGKMSSVEEYIKVLNLFGKKVDSVFNTNISSITSSEEFKISIALIYIKYHCTNGGGVSREISKYLKDKIK